MCGAAFAFNGVTVDPAKTIAEDEKSILVAYARGVLPRSVAMQRLGIDWYGDLLQKMNTYGIKRPSVSAADMLIMQKSVDEVFASLDKPLL